MKYNGHKLIPSTIRLTLLCLSRSSKNLNKQMQITFHSCYKNINGSLNLGKRNLKGFENTTEVKAVYC